MSRQTQREKKRNDIGIEYINTTNKKDQSYGKYNTQNTTKYILKTNKKLIKKSIFNE